MYSLSARISVILLALLVGFSVVLFGAKFPFAQGLLPIPCAVLAILAAGLRQPLYSKSGYKKLILAIFIPVTVLIVWSILQMLPLGSALASSFWGLQQGGWSSISLSPGLTMQHVVYASGLLLLAFASYRLAANHALALLYIVAGVITLACVYGIIQFAMGNGYVLWLPKTSYQTSLTGTFISRNAFATLAGLGVLVNFGIMLQRVGEVSSRLSLQQRFKAFWWLVLRPGWLVMTCAFICFIALLLTGSRAGIAASLCGVLVLLGSLAGMREPVRWPLIGMLVLFGTFALLMLAVLGADLGTRLLNLSDDALLRGEINIGSRQLAGQFWLAGTGLGTYMPAFFTVHTPEFLAKLNGVIDHAHNTYYELLVELGLPAVLLAAISGAALAGAYIIGLNVRRRAIMWPALGVATLVLVGGHALADFSLSVPAFASVVIIVLMATLAQSLPVKPEETAQTRKAYWVVVPAVAVVAVAGWFSAANYQAMQAGATVRQLASLQPVGPGPMFLAQRHLMRCLSINAWHPTCRTDLAQVQMSLATGYGVTGPRADVGMVYLAMARNTYLEAVAKAPVDPQAWYRLARIEAFLGNTKQAEEYLANSVITGGAEPGLAMQRMPLLLQFLPQASPENASLFKSNIMAHWAAAPRQVGLALKDEDGTGVLATLASLQPDTPELRAYWKRHIRKPFPVAAPLGETPETR